MGNASLLSETDSLEESIHPVILNNIDYQDHNYYYYSSYYYYQNRYSSHIGPTKNPEPGPALKVPAGHDSNGRHGGGD